MTDYGQMRQLGLSRVEVDCYETICKQGGGSAAEIAERLQRSRSSIYYAIKHLQDLGFVRSSQSRGLSGIAWFYAIRLDKALENLAIYQRHAVREIVEEQVERSIKLQSGPTKLPNADRGLALG